MTTETTDDQGEDLPPLPMTSRQARAMGLKTFPSFARCSKDGTNIRRTLGGKCVACLERARAATLEAARRAVKLTEEQLQRQHLRELKAREAQHKREVEQARKDAARAQRAKDREEREKERRRLKAAATRAKNKAAREAVAVDTAPPPWV